MKHKLSLVIITLNEEKNIERCIRSVPFADDIVVVDSGSRDRTLEIAKSLGARTFHEDWQGFYKQKTKATELAQHHLVLSLDADEALTESSQKEVLALLNQDTLSDAYEFPRLTYHLGQWLYHGGNYPDAQIRLYDRRKTKWLNAQVHERVLCDTKTRMQHPILHWPFSELADQVTTINRYSALRAVDFESKGKRFSAFSMFTKMISKFIEAYFLKQGFRDGVPGLIGAVNTSYATFLRWAKLYENTVVKKRPPLPPPK